MYDEKIKRWMPETAIYFSCNYFLRNYRHDI